MLHKSKLRLFQENLKSCRLCGALGTHSPLVHLNLVFYCILYFMEVRRFVLQGVDNPHNPAKIEIVKYREFSSKY